MGIKKFLPYENKSTEMSSDHLVEDIEGVLEAATPTYTQGKKIYNPYSKHLYSSDNNVYKNEELEDCFDEDHQQDFEKELSSLLFQSTKNQHSYIDMSQCEWSRTEYKQGKGISEYIIKFIKYRWAKGGRKQQYFRTGNYSNASERI